MSGCTYGYKWAVIVNNNTFLEMPFFNPHLTPEEAERTVLNADDKHEHLNERHENGRRLSRTIWILD